MKIWTIILCACLLVITNFFVSCVEPDGSRISVSQLTSLIDRNNDRDDDDDDDRAEFCYDRDSCQDSCDYIFVGASARSTCYELEFDQVNDLEEAFDVLSDSSITKRELEDLDEDSLEFFLETDVDSWLDLIQGQHKKRKEPNGYSTSEMEVTLKWIAENSNVAESILEYDEDSDVLYTLFERLGSKYRTLSATLVAALDNDPTHRGFLRWESSRLSICGRTSCNSTHGVSVDLDNSPFNFLEGFIGLSQDLNINNLVYDGDTFVGLADAESNGDAVELAHISARRFCEDATNRNEGDEEVGQCLMALYCSIRAVDSGNVRKSGSYPSSTRKSFDNNIFDIVDNYESYLKVRNCSYDRLKDEDNFD